MRLRCVLGIAALLWWAQGAAAITITGYVPAVNDRFTDDFPAEPVPNTAPSFIGLPYDWSGVGWAAAAPYWGFAFVTPRHYLVARHAGGASTIAVQGPDGMVHTVTQDAVIDTGYGMMLPGPVGDLSVGRLVASLPPDWQIARYPVLDLNPSSDTSGSYDAQPLLVYGHGDSSPRIGPDVVTATGVTGPVSIIISSLDTVQLEPGDSGSPVFVPWTRPGGGPELAIIGNNAAVSDVNFHNLAASSPALVAINAITAPDGFALRLAGEPAATWHGAATDGSGTGDDLGAGGNWTSGTVPTDLYAAFSGTAALTRAIEVDTAVNLRGMVFLPTGPGTAGFTFAHPTNVLTVGRGGIVNEDGSRQVFEAPLALGDHQVWDVGAGGVTAAAIDTQGHLLEIAGTGTAVITGPVSGTGGLALSGHRLELTGVNAYAGTTWAHAGTLVVSGTISASAGVVVAPGAVVAGTGWLPEVSGGGIVDPGPGVGILTAVRIDGADDLGFDLDFTRPGPPDWSAGASSGNDVLRLTGTTPFAAPLGPANQVRVFLDCGELVPGMTLRGGFFTDVDADFLGSVSAAAFTFFTAAGTGTTIHDGRRYAGYAGPLTFIVATVPVTAGFAGGSEAGFVTEFLVVPEPAAAPLAGVCLLVLLRRRRRRVAGGRRGTMPP